MRKRAEQKRGHQDVSFVCFVQVKMLVHVEANIVAHGVSNIAVRLTIGSAFIEKSCLEQSLERNSHVELGEKQSDDDDMAQTWVTMSHLSFEQGGRSRSYL